MANGLRKPDRLMAKIPSPLQPMASVSTEKLNLKSAQAKLVELSIAISDAEVELDVMVSTLRESMERELEREAMIIRRLILEPIEKDRRAVEKRIAELKSAATEHGSISR